MQNELFESASVPKAYMKLALPVVLSMMVSLVYNMVDTYFIALTGKQELVAGVSLAAPIFTLMIAFGDIFGLGGSSLISRLFGEKREEEAKRASAFCLWAAIGFGIFVTIVLLVFRTPILKLLGTDAATFEYAGEYYTWIAVGAASIILGLVPSNILRTEGLAMQAMAGSILGSIVNIILDPVFIFGLGQGAAGAAMATVIGNVIADVYYIYVMNKKAKRLSVSLKEIKIPGTMIRDILVIGIPASITNLMQSIMIMITNHYLIAYGTDKVAAMGIALKANMITAMILVGFAFGCQPLVGYNYGARNKKRLKEILAFCYKFECGLAVILAVILSAGARPLIRVFMKTPEIVDSGVLMLRLQQAGMMFMAVVLVTTCVFQSAGKAMGAFLLSVSRQGVIYGIVIVIASHMIGYHGVLAAQAVSDFLTALMAAILLKHELWSELTDIKRNEEAV